MKPIWAFDLDGVPWAPGICFIGGSGGDSKQSAQQQSGPVANPAFPMIAANAARATSIADNPFEAYTGHQVAPPNPALTSSWDLFKSIGMNNPGAPTMGSAIDTTRGVAGFQPSNVSAGPGTNSITAGSLPGTDLSGYLNPFQKNVTDTTMADLERQRQIQRVHDNQGATVAGGGSAFGGSRAGVADSLTNEAYDRNSASTLAGLNFGNFNNAQGMATGDLNRALAAATSNQGAQANDLNRALAAATSNQGAGLSGAQLQLGAGAQLGALSGQQQGQAITGANVANQAGTQQQTIQQQMADAAYQEFMRRINQPYQGQDLITRAMGLLPGGVSQAGTGSSQGGSSQWGFHLIN